MKDGKVNSVGVVGGGVVGKATARTYLEYVNHVRVYDTVKAKATHTLSEVMACDLIFVCLPEGDVDAFCRSQKGSVKSLVLRSTVPIGTTKRLRRDYSLPCLVHSPEFLTARCALVDSLIPARQVIGGPEGLECKTEGRLRDLYHRRFPGVPVHIVTCDESEAIKLFVNGFFAVKIAYFNEIRSLADALKLDWDAVLAGILTDGRITHSHTQVPGPDGKRGFGGACLPKDIAHLVNCITDSGGVPHVTHGACFRNQTIDRNE